MIRIQVNGRTMEAEVGESILSAVSRAGIRIPTLCSIEGLHPAGTCRVCEVEVLDDSTPSDVAAGQTGRGLSCDDGTETLVPACSHPVHEGMRILTHSDKVIEARRTLIELLLADHPDDCLYCGKSRSCRLKELAEEYGIRERSFPGSGKRKNVPPDTGSSALIRDGAKCILCGNCVRICGERQGIAAMDFTGRGGTMAVEPPFHQDMAHSPCIACGQCLAVCPTGALREQDSLSRVLSALNSDSFYPVLQCDPASMAALAGELFPRWWGGGGGACGGTAASFPGQALPEDCISLIRGALACIGFRKIYDSSWGYGISLIRTAGEWISRFREEETNGGGVSFPLISACPALWRKYVSEECPELSPLFSKVPDGWESLGSFLKTQFSSGSGGPAGCAGRQVFSVGILPCIAKKADVAGEGNPGSALDAVLSTRECAGLFRLYGIDFSRVPRRGFDSPFALCGASPEGKGDENSCGSSCGNGCDGDCGDGGGSSGCGLLFSRPGGMTGGLFCLLSMAALTGDFSGRKGRQGFRGIRAESLEGFPGRVFRMKTESTGTKEITGVVLNGAGESLRFLKSLLLPSGGKKREKLHFAELTACPGGCLGGGGQILQRRDCRRDPVPDRMEPFAGMEAFLSDLCGKLRAAGLFETEKFPEELLPGGDARTGKQGKKRKQKESHQ